MRSFLTSMTPFSLLIVFFCLNVPQSRTSWCCTSILCIHSVNLVKNASFSYYSKHVFGISGVVDRF